MHRQWIAKLVALLTAVSLLAACAGTQVEQQRQERSVSGSPARGEQLIMNYGCGACHTIPGIPGANTLVGPPLTSFGERSFIAGALPNTTENLVSWIQNPQEIEPNTAMPNLGVTPQDAQDIVAYLYSLR